MKSRILNLKSYETVDISAYQIPFVLDEGKLNYELNRLRNPYISWQEGTKVSAGDMVVCRMESALSRFNKEKMTIAVGSGMLPRELEQTVDGMEVNECRTAVVGEDTVKVTVLSVKNKIIPEMSDDMVKKLELDGVGTVEEYRTYLIDQQKRAKAEEIGYDANRYVLDSVLDESEFVLHKGDWRYIVDLKVARLKTLCRQDGLVFEEMTEAEFAAGRVPGVKCYEGVTMLEQDFAWDMLRTYLAGVQFAELEGFAVDEKSYESYIEEYCRMWHVTEEEAKESNPYALYQVIEYSGYYTQKIWNYVVNNIFTEE